MDNTSSVRRAVKPNKDRVHRASLWLEKHPGHSSTAVTGPSDVRKAEGGWDQISITSSMEAQMDVEDLVDRRALMMAEDKSADSDAEMLEPVKPRAKINLSLFAHMGSGTGCTSSDSCHIITEPDEFLIDKNAIDICSSADSVSVHPLGEAGTSNAPNEISYGFEPPEGRPYAKYFVRQDCDTRSDSIPPSLVETTRSTVTSLHPATPPTVHGGGQSQQWLENVSPQFEEPIEILGLKHMVHVSDSSGATLQGSPSSCPINHELANLPRSVSLDDKARRHKNARGSSHSFLRNVPEQTWTHGIMVALAEEADWQTRIKTILRPPDIHLPADHMYFLHRESVLDSLQAEFHKCPSGQGTDGRKSVSFASSSTSQGTSRNTTQALGKRPLQDNEDDEDERGDSSGLPPPKKKSKDNEPHGRRLACPYYKMNIQKYDCCVGYDLNEIRAVKQHLDRKHQGSRHHCPTCWEQFETQTGSDLHIAARTCTRKPRTDEGMSAHQAEEIASIARSRKKMAEDERWFRIWDVLFPGSPRPRSAYIAHGAMEVLSHLEPFLVQDRGSHIISDFLRGIRHHLYTNVAGEELEHDIVIRFFRRIFEEYTEDLEGPSRNDVQSSSSYLSSSTSIDRSILPPTTDATTVDEEDSLNASHTLQPSEGPTFCFDADEEQVNVDPTWGQGVTPFEPMELSYSNLLSGEAGPFDLDDERFDIDDFVNDDQRADYDVAQEFKSLQDDDKNV